ncbi:MAG: rod shape-determining protein [Thermotogae bacterium]|nr:rod shape-determining protein [Thermotogota bacterium]
MRKGDLGVDLGTATFLVYQKGKGMVIYEPSYVAVSRKSGKIIAIGNEAKEMKGKTPKDIVALKPMKDGVIAEYTVIEEVIRSFIKRTKSGLSFFKPNMVIGVPTKITNVEHRAVVEAAINAGASKVYVVHEPIAAAIGANVDVVRPQGSMIIDVGGGTTDIAVISLGGVVIGESLRFAGDAMDDAIVKYVRKRFQLSIGTSTAEEVKIKIGKAHPDVEDYEMEVKGRDVMTGLPKKIVLNSTEVLEALDEILKMLIIGVRNVLEKTPPELASDIMSEGIYLVGGGSKLRGLDKLITQETGLQTISVSEPEYCVALGTGKLLDDEQLLMTVASAYGV